MIEQTYSQGSCSIIEFWLWPRGAGVKWGLCLLKSLLELDIRRNNVWGKIENGIGIKLTSVLYKSFRVLKVGNLFDYQSKIRVKMCCPVQLPPSHFTLSQSELWRIDCCWTQFIYVHIYNANRTTSFLSTDYCWTLEGVSENKWIFRSAGNIRTSIQIKSVKISPWGIWAQYLDQIRSS